MTTPNHLWLVIDHDPDADTRRERELVICGEGTRPNDIVNVSDKWAENVYVRLATERDISLARARVCTQGLDHDGKMMMLAERWQEQDAEQRRKRGE